MRKLTLILATAAISVLSCFSAFAGTWQQNDAGWWYDNGDSTYAQGGWHWIDGRCYYFTSEGYCLMGTTTPDGYQVDGSGAWIINGVVQTQGAGGGTQEGNVYTIGALKFALPSGFTFYSQDETMLAFAKSNPDVMIGVCDEPLTALDGMNFDVSAYEEELLDYGVKSAFGDYASKTRSQLNSGRWERYTYNSVFNDGSADAMVLYGRLKDNRLQMIFFVGDLNGIDPDGIINSSLR